MFQKHKLLLGNLQNTTKHIFSAKGEYPPSLRTPIAENHFAKKNLSRNGGYQPPLTESPLSFARKNSQKGQKWRLVLDKVKMDLKGYKINQKVLSTFWQVP